MDRTTDCLDDDNGVLNMFVGVTYCGMSELLGALVLTGVDSLCRI
jgi:hypothetical protein